MPSVSAAWSTIDCEPEREGTVLYDGGRCHARDFAFKSAGRRPSLCPERNGPLKVEDGLVAKRKGTAANSVRVVLAPADDMPVYDPSKPDPRLRELVRLLARQAARKFVEAEQERATRERLLK